MDKDQLWQFSLEDFQQKPTKAIHDERAVEFWQLQNIYVIP
jgi:hypothetical protein